ncbi:MAG: preprotein translocase subunit SecY, partial [Streptosporangiaceae bacterium]
MLTAFLRAFRTPDLRKKLLFTIFIIAVFRMGSSLPTPGVSESAINACLQTTTKSSIFQLVNLFSGGSLLKLTVFALGIMPYITASIILQLLAVVIPRLETLRQEGQSGQARITQYTRYLTIGLAILQSTGIIALARSGNLIPGCTQPLIPHPSVFTIGTMVICMTAGTAVIMWLGELITDRGVGNGMSLIIFIQVIAVIPGEMLSIYKTKHAFVFLLVLALGIAIIAFVALMEQAQRRVPVQYAKRMVGRRMYGGTSTYIPLKVNQAGVIPVIFASSLLYIPQLASQLFGANSNSAWVRWVNINLVTGDKPSYGILFFLLIVFFTYFYVSITFNPTEVADNMKKYGGFIPGIRPGGPTAG